MNDLYYSMYATLYENEEIDIHFLNSIPLKHSIEISARVSRNAQGMSYHEATELARRFHFLLLTKLSKENPNPSFSEKEITFRQFENKVKQIYHNDLLPNEIEFLKSLPSIKDWDHDIAYAKVKESPYFKDEVSKQNSPETLMLNKIFEKAKSYGKDEAEFIQLYKQLYAIHKKEHGEAKAIQMIEERLRKDN